MPIKVFIIEGHNIFLWGLQQLIKNNGAAMQLVGSAANSADAMATISAASPDVILLDLDQYDEGSLDIHDLITQSHARILMLTRYGNQSLQDKAILDGALGVLDRQAPPEMLLEAIVKVHRGQLWLDRAATGRIFVAMSHRESAKEVDTVRSRISSLTEREKAVFDCISGNTGDSARIIAKKLHISESTLRNHLTSIYEKMGVSNRLELISFALKNKHPSAPV
jgi:two-component system nitrate/nitrite response regulator NarL